MNRTELLIAAGAGALTACTRAASGLVVPSGAAAVRKPSAPQWPQVGHYYFNGPGWVEGKYGYGYTITDLNTKTRVGYMIAEAWYGTGGPGVKVGGGWGCKNDPPYYCDRTFPWAYYSIDEQDERFKQWLTPGKAIEIFTNWFHVADGVPSGGLGGTLRDYSGDPIFTVYYRNGKGYATEYSPAGQYEFDWQGLPGPSGPDIGGGCRSAITESIVGFGTALAGCITTEVGVGWIGVLVGSAEMIDGAMNINEKCH